MKLSAFGEKFSDDSGIVELMSDLGDALRENPNIIFMGGGNPAHIADVEAVFLQRLESIIKCPKQRHSLFGIYQSPRGDKDFRNQLAGFLNKQYHWQLTSNNIAVSNGSQSAFFVLYNLLAGTMSDGSVRSIHLPLAPEYLGYNDVGLCDNFFTATQPGIELLENNQFKYHVDFSKLELDESVAAICVSRPTNPTGNVLTDEEIAHLDGMAKKRHIPLVIDGAYGIPFPGIIFTRANAHWNNNTILALSLSKLGLPGIRTGIIVANEEIIQAYANANTIVNLACGTLGPAIAKELCKTGEMLILSRDKIMPYYQHAAQQTVQLFKTHFKDLPYRVHKPEGAIFLWLWFEGLPISSQNLYERLKKRGVLIVSGHHFFAGIDDNWVHKNECIRVSYAQNYDVVSRGIEIIAEEVSRAFIE